MNEKFFRIEKPQGVQLKTKEQVLEELKTEPLKYALEIANVTNAQELVERLAQHETKAGFENVFSKLSNFESLKSIKVVYKSEQGANASYHTATKTLSIDTTYGNSANIGDFYVTIIHELFHYVFRGADIASGLNILYGLTSIKNTINKLPIHNKYRHLYETILHNVSKEDQKSHYGLSSTDEFISEAYSNPAFQNFLKSVSLKKNKGVISKTKDLLLSVVTLNARVITKEISEKDAFEAFRNIDLESLDLLENFQENLDRHKEEQVNEEKS